MYEKMRKLTSIIIVVVGLFLFSGVLAQDIVDLSALTGAYDLGVFEPNNDPSVRETQILFPETFDPGTCTLEIDADYIFGSWDCLEGEMDPPPAGLYFTIDHPSDDYGYWRAFFQPADYESELPLVSDFQFTGSIDHNWSDLAGQEVTVKLSIDAFTWPECTLETDFLCTINNITLAQETPIPTTPLPWGTIKTLYH